MNLGYPEREWSMHSPAVRGREQNFGFSPYLLGQRAWRGGWIIEYYRGIAIGGTKHGGDTEYWYVPHLKNFWRTETLAQPGTLWPFQNIYKLWLLRLREKNIDLPEP
jgi:hypothetical protein